MRVEKRNRKFGSFFGNHLSGSFIMSVAKEFTTDRNTDVKTAGNRVIEGCNSLLVAYTRDSFKVRAGLPTENKNAVSLAGVEIIVLEGGVIGATVISAAKAGIESAKIIAKERIADKNFFMVKPPLILGLKIAVAQFPGPLESPLSSTY